MHATAIQKPISASFEADPGETTAARATSKGESMKLPCGCEPFNNDRPNETHGGECKMLCADPLVKQPPVVIEMFEQLNELWYLANPSTA